MSSMFKSHRLKALTTMQFVMTILLLLWAVPFAHARTLHVEKWGDDFSGTCAKNSPCLTISMALGLSTQNDTIKVGPGIYVEQNLAITTPGLKLQSTAGRYATAIIGDESSALEINAVRVKVGKTGKGFTFGRQTFDAQQTSTIGIVVDVPDATSHIKIEGNRFGIPRSGRSTAHQDYSNFQGISIRSGGGRMSIRHNIFQNSQASALYCSQCSNTLIAENRFESNGGNGVEINDSTNTTIRQNLSTSNMLSGLALRGLHSGMVVNNIVEKNHNDGLGSNAISNTRILNNIASANSWSGLWISSSESTKIQKNLVIDNHWHGIEVSGLQNPSFENNIATGSHGSGYNIGASTMHLKKNASFANENCGLEIHSGNIENTRFFFSNNVSDPVCVNSAATYYQDTPLDRPTPTNTGKVAKLVGG